MKSTIDEFYDFECNFVDWIDRGERYSEMREEINGLISKLISNPTEEQKLGLDKIAILYKRIEGEAEKAGYKAGFKRGVALVIESII